MWDVVLSTRFPRDLRNNDLSDHFIAFGNSGNRKVSGGDTGQMSLDLMREAEETPTVKKNPGTV